MENTPQPTDIRIEMKVIPPHVVQAVLSAPPVEAAHMLRAFLHDLSALVVLRHGVQGLSTASHRLNNLARVFVNQGVKHLNYVKSGMAAFADSEVALSPGEAIEQVADAEKHAKEWLDRIKNASKGGEENA